MQKLLFAKVEFWVVLLVFLVGLLGMIGFGAAVLDAERGTRLFGPISGAARSIAEIPSTVKDLFHDTNAMVAIAPKRFSGRPAGWRFTGDKPLAGYLLLSRYDGDRLRHVIELVSLSDGVVRHEWAPDADSLLPPPPGGKELTGATNWKTSRYRAIHPILNDDGEILIKDHYSVLMGIDACGNRNWVQKSVYFHHSTERDGNGGFWVPSLEFPQTIDRVQTNFFEDALTRIDAKGHVLSKRSLTALFIDNGLEHLVFPQGHSLEDPLHLNDIQPVLADGPYWKKGDLFLSIRRLSMIMLYRPSTDEIVWKKQGPWMSQHDVDILDDHRIAVFDNNAYNRGTGGRVDGTNQIAVYDFATGEVSWPWADSMEAADVKTPLEGLMTILPDGGLFVEEEGFGRIVFFAPDGSLRAEYINKASDGRPYRLGWSRYLSQAAGDDALAKLSGITCNDPT